MKHLKAYVETVKASNEDVIRVIGSTSAQDRHGEVIAQEGWDLKNYKKNPVILWGHNSGLGEQRPPIGKAVKVWVDGTGKSAKLMFDVVFDMADDFARSIAQKVKDGFVNAVSVGFRPTDMEGRKFLKMELLELSFVPVPANPEAIVQMKELGLTPTDWAGKAMEAGVDVEGTVEDSEPVDDAESPTNEEVEDTAPESEESGELEEATAEDVEPEAQEEKQAPIKKIREAVKELDNVEEFSMRDLKEVMKILNQATNYALKKLRETKEAREG